MGGTDQLLDRAKQGDAAAYDQLFDRVATRLLTYVELRLGGSLREKIEPLDILQEAYLEAHRGFSGFKPLGRDAFLRWMYRIIDHTILDQADWFSSKKRAAGRLESSPAIIEHLRGALTGPSTRAARAEERDLLVAAIDRLEEPQRRLLLLHHFQGQSAVEIALAMSHSPKHVRRLLRKAEAALGVEVERLRGESGGFLRVVESASTESPSVLAARLLERCARPQPAPEARAPQQIGRYELVSEVGRGAVGIVYRAHDPDRGRDVALKLLRATEEDARRRFVREALALTKLSHPGIASALDAGEHDGAPFLVLDLVTGIDVQARLDAHGPLPVVEALRAAVQLARALEHAHEQGVLHRDVKPCNVVMGDGGSFVLTDFSLAKLLDADLSQLSERGQQLGTEGYWPPEQARGDLRAIGPASDVYGVGATLHAMLTGAPPFTGRNAVERLRATLRERPKAPSASRPEVPIEVDRICARCLEKDPVNRFSSAGELADALEQALRTLVR